MAIFSKRDDDSDHAAYYGPPKDAVWLSKTDLNNLKNEIAELKLKLKQLQMRNKELEKYVRND